RSSQTVAGGRPVLDPGYLGQLAARRAEDLRVGIVVHVMPDETTGTLRVTHAGRLVGGPDRDRGHRHGLGSWSLDEASDRGYDVAINGFRSMKRLWPASQSRARLAL